MDIEFDLQMGRRKLFQTLEVYELLVRTQTIRTIQDFESEERLKAFVCSLYLYTNRPQPESVQSIQMKKVGNDTWSITVIVKRES